MAITLPANGWVLKRERLTEARNANWTAFERFENPLSRWHRMPIVASIDHAALCKMERNGNAIDEGRLCSFVRHLLNRAIKSEIAMSMQTTDDGSDVKEDGEIEEGSPIYGKQSTNTVVKSLQDKLEEIYNCGVHEAVAFTDVSKPTEDLFRERTVLGSSGEEDDDSWNDEDDNEQIIEISDICKHYPSTGLKDTGEHAPARNPELPRASSHSGLGFKRSSNLFTTLLGRGKTSSVHSREPVTLVEPDEKPKPEKKDRKGFKLWRKKKTRESNSPTSDELRPPVISRNSRAEEPTIETKSKLFQLFTRNRQTERMNAQAPTLESEI